MTKLNMLRKLVMESTSDILIKKELLDLGYDEAWLSYALRALVDEKMLYRLKRGVYSKTEPGSIDPYRAATLLYGGYVGLTTAAYIYGWTDEYQYTVFVLTGKLSKKINIGKHEIRYMAAGKMFFGSCYFNNYTVSTRPKTAFDLVYYANVVGKHNVVKCLSGARLSGKEWKDFIAFCLRFGSKSLMQKAGYLVEKTNGRVPGIRKLMPKNPVVVKLGRNGRGRLDKKWMVVDYD